MKKLIYLNLILTLIIISVWFFRDTPFGAAIISTSSTDTLSTFRTNVNTSLSSVAAELYLSKSGVTLSPTSTSYFLGVGTSSVAFPLTVQGGIYTASSSIMFRSDDGTCHLLISQIGSAVPILSTTTCR